MPGTTIPLAPAESAARRGNAPETRPRLDDQRWVSHVRRAAIAGFPAAVAFCVLAPHIAGRLFWTVAIAALPLFFVVAGYHRWRRICPLAFVAQWSARRGRPGRRRAGKWFQAHAYHVSFAFLLTSLWLRLVATNGDGRALAVFLVAIAAAAFATDAIFTGKTWCNYICPISFVEKIYTEPRNLHPTPNSQCEKCTACKPACPDINEENGYWKEILLASKRHAYFAFPGLVLAFYVFYFLQAGAWEYYFSGRWTNQIGLVRTAFLPGTDATTAGVVFLPAIPRALSAAATLLVGAAVSLACFSAAEPWAARWLGARGRDNDEAAVRHVMFTAAAFTAFVTFYTFAGAPTLRLVPGLPHAFQVVVVCAATLALVRRIGRRRTDFAEETLARQIIAQWPWTDAPPPRDLREAVLIHRVRSQSSEEARARAIELYKNAVRETVNSGIVSRSEIHRLDAIRDQMRISHADHERIMAELSEEDGALEAALVVSPEKRLQLETYGEALAVQLARRHEAPDDGIVRALREQYGVTEQEHALVLERLVGRHEGIAAYVTEAPAAIEQARLALERLQDLRSPAVTFMMSLLDRRSRRATDTLLRALGCPSGEPLRDRLLSTDPSVRAAAIREAGSRISPKLASRLAESQDRARCDPGHATLLGCLRANFSSPDPFVRASALYLLESFDEATADDYAALEGDEHPVVRETAAAAKRCATGESIHAEPTTLSKMIALASVELFGALEPEDLATLAQAGEEVWLTEGEALCREGEIGDEAFIVLTGEVSVLRRDGATEHLVAVVGPGGIIGELAVLDPAPRNATVVASSVAVRALKLDGGSFRHALSASPAVAEVIIRTLARRLRGQEHGPVRSPVPH